MGGGGQGGVGTRMSSMRVVGPTGRDQSYVSTGVSGTGGQREGLVGRVGRRVGGSGPRVHFSLDKELELGGTGLGGEGRGEGLPLPVGEVLSDRDKAFKAMEMLKEVLGEEVVASVWSLVQGHLPPKVPTPSPPISD